MTSKSLLFALVLLCTSQLTSNLSFPLEKAQASESCSEQHPFNYIRGPDFSGHQMMTYAVDPNDPGRIFVANNSTVFRSNDAGCTWKKVFFPSMLSRFGVSSAPSCETEGIDFSFYCLFNIATIDVVARQDQSYVYMQAPPGIWVSRDAGDRWEVWYDANQDPLGYIGFLSFAPSDPDIVYTCQQSSSGPARFLASGDAGKSWQEANLPPEVVAHHRGTYTSRAGSA